VKRLTDPRTMRALAHPLRLKLLGLLRVEGPQTATSLAGMVGESVPLVSYHLRQLAEHGFIEPDPERARDNRERWWRSSHDRTQWSEVDFLDTPEQIEAGRTLLSEVNRVYFESIETFTRDHASWSPEWIDASDTSDWWRPLNAAQLKQMREELHEVIERWEGVEPGPGAENTRVILHMFPLRKPNL
jgi:DNA-binding transcriptional ArsR family regulator